MPSVTSAKYNLKELQVATENQLESFQDVLLGVERDRRTFSTTATAIKVVHTAVCWGTWMHLRWVRRTGS